jgi:hypothetical protein
VAAWSYLYATYALTLYWANQSRSKQLLWWGLGLNLLWIPLFSINTKLAFLLLMAMIGIATFAEQQLSADGYHLESIFQLTYILWLIFALSLNGYIALSCPN